MQPHEKSRPGGSGAAIQQVGQTTNRIPLTWHEQCEWENAASYAQGHADGYAAAERAIAEEIAQAVGVKPYDRRDVIRWLIRTIGQPREPYSTAGNGTTLTVAERDVLGRWAA